MELSTAQRYDIESAQARLDEMVARACDRSQHMLWQGAALREVLTALATVGEVVSGPGAACSILILDKDGLLRNGASPNLPPDYLDAIDRLKPNPRVGTCAAAAATGSMVITPDFHADDKWGELRHLPPSSGVRRGVEHSDQIIIGRCVGNLRHVFAGTARTVFERNPSRRDARSGGGDSDREVVRW